MARQAKPWFWKARRAWFVTVAGVRHRLGADKESALRAFRELIKRPVATHSAGDSLAAVIDAFLDWVQSHRSPDTFEWYRYRLQRFVDRYPKLRTSELKPFHVQQWVDSYPKLSQTSRRNYLRTMKRCLLWAKKQGYIDGNPIEHLEVPGAERREVLISAVEYQSFLCHVTDNAFRDLLVVTWETGCRPQESLRVEARHVDLANRRWVFPVKESKGKRQPRVVYLSDTALEITRRLAQANPTGALFRNSVGVPWTTDAVNCAFDRVRVRMGRARMKQLETDVSDDDVAAMVDGLNPTRTQKGRTLTKTPAELREEARRKLRNKQAMSLVPRFSLYALRHAWATRALQAGVDGLTVAILMGHSDPSTLAQVYQHLSLNPRNLQEQMARVL